MTARGTAPRAVRVTNLGHNPVQAAGRVWPPRRTIEVPLTATELEAITQNRRLQVEPQDEPDPAAEPGAG